MADTKISDLTAVTTPAFTDLFVGVQGGSNFKYTMTQVLAPHVAAADPHPGYVLESAAGTIHTQNANNVTITGGSITGITDLAVADGGTGASDAAGARTNLGLVIGTNVQAFDADLTTLSTAFTTASASGPASLAFAEDTDNGSNTVTIIAPASVASNKTATLQDVSGNIYVSSGTDVAVTDGGTGASTAADARTNLGLVIGTDVAAFSHTHTASNVTDFSEAVDDRVAALAVAGTNMTITYNDGAGTLTFDAAGGGAAALDDLTDVTLTAPSNGQVLKFNGTVWINDTDATGGGGGALNDLTDVVITAAATGDILYFNGTNWVDQAIDQDLLTLAVPASTTISAYGATLVDDADASAARTTLGLVIGTNVQAFDADLTTLASAFTTASASGPASLAFAEDTDNGSNTVTIIAPASVASNKTATLQDVTGTIYVTGGTDVAVADGGTGASDAATARTNLGLAIGSDVQAFDSDLNTIAGLTATTNNFMVASGSAWASRTPTQAIAHLGLDADIATLSLPASTTISTFGASLIDDAAASNARTTLGLVIGTDVAAVVHTRYFEKVYSVPGTLVVSTGVARMYFKRAATITNVYAGVGTAPTGAAIRVDVHKNGTTIFTTQGNRPDIAVSTNSDMTATPDVTSVSAGDYLTVDIDVIGSTIAGADLVVGIEYTESI